MIAAIALAMTVLSPGASAETIPPAAIACSGCHGASSRSAIPRIKGHDSQAIIAAMQGFRSGAIDSTVMGRIAKGFSDEEIRAIADWYAREGAK